MHVPRPPACTLSLGCYRPPSRTLSFACYCGLLLLLAVGRSSFLLIRGAIPRTQLAQLPIARAQSTYTFAFRFFLAQVLASGGGPNMSQKWTNNTSCLRSKSHLCYTTFWITFEGQFLFKMWKNNTLKQHSITCIRGFVGKRRH